MTTTAATSTSELSTLVKSDYARKSFLERIGLEQLDNFLYPLINQKRDVVFVHWLIVLSALLIPTAVYLCFNFSYLLSAVYLFLVVRFLGVYILMLHCTTHSVLFTKSFWYLNHYSTVVLGNFLGMSPYTYYCHHIKMHHAEGNGPKDLSCTMFYQRDSIVDFLRYFGRFLFFVTFEIVIYFCGKGQYNYAALSVCGEVSYHFVGISLLKFDVRVGIVLYLLPFLIARFGMMSGNWVQHAFVSQDHPNNDYMSSITCIDTPYNWMCFNDGYHTSHHLHPKRHWTEHPGHLVEREKDYHKNTAIVFKGLDYLQIWYYLMTQNYSKLAQHYVCLNGETKSEKEIITLFKARLQKFESK